VRTHWPYQAGRTDPGIFNPSYLFLYSVLAQQFNDFSVAIAAGHIQSRYLSGNFGIYSPYWFAVVVLALGLMGEVITWVALKTGQRGQPSQSLPRPP